MNNDLMPMPRLLEVDRDRHVAFDRAAPRLAQAQVHVSLERARGVRHLRQAHGNVGVALRVGDGGEVERLAHGLDALVGLPELVVGKALDTCIRRFHDDVALDREAFRGRAVEIAAERLDGLRLVG